MPSSTLSHAMSKVPAVTLGFWIIKILATTLGETAGDTLSMTMDLGYLTSTAIFLSVFLVLVIFQIRARRFSAALYWATIVASTTAGTTMADFADRSLGVGYAGGSTKGGLRLGEYGPNAASGSLLLGHDHILANARHRTGRLDCR
jgi:uncharacterized membrane-anchored protein